MFNLVAYPPGGCLILSLGCHIQGGLLVISSMMNYSPLVANFASECLATQNVLVIYITCNYAVRVVEKSDMQFKCQMVCSASMHYKRNW